MYDRLDGFIHKVSEKVITVDIMFSDLCLLVSNAVSYPS